MSRILENYMQQAEEAQRAHEQMLQGFLDDGYTLTDRGTLERFSEEGLLEVIHIN